jgi:hypothetical protein
MSRIQAASALLLLSLPNGFASPLAQEALPIFQLLRGASSAAAAPTGAVLALLHPAAVSQVPKPLDVSDLTGGVLNSLDALKSIVSPALVDLTSIRGPQNNFLNPIPNPLIPSPTPVIVNDDASIIVTSVPTFDATPSPIEVVSAVLSLAGTPLALPSNGSLAGNFSGLDPTITPVPLPFPLDVAFPDPLLPVETAISSPPPVTATGPHVLALSDFVTIIQQIANVVSGFFQILTPMDGPATDGLSVPFPLSNATLNSTVLERRQIEALTATAPALPPQVVVNLVQKFINLSVALMKIAKAFPAAGDKIPDLAGTVGEATSKLPLSTSNLPLNGLLVPAAGSVIGKPPVPTPNLSLPSPPISRIRRQALPDLSASTSAAPIEKITTLLGPLVNLATGLLSKVKEVPVVGGAVANVPLADAVGVVGKGDVSAIDGATATGMVQTLMELAGKIVSTLDLPDNAIASGLPSGAALAGITKRDLGDLDPTLSMGIVSHVLDILKTIVEESPAGSATKAVPLDKVLSVANALGKRSLSVDPNTAFAILKQIIGTVAKLISVIPGVDQAAAALPAISVPLDTLAGATAGLPINGLISNLPLGSITDNSPVGNLGSTVPGIDVVSNLLSALGSDPVESPTSALPVGALGGNSAGGLLPNLPVTNLASTLPVGSVGSVGGLGKRDMSATQSDTVMNVAQEFLAMALTMSKELPAANAMSSKATMEKRAFPVTNVSSAIIGQVLKNILKIVSDLSKQIQTVSPVPLPIPGDVPPIPLPSPIGGVPAVPIAPAVPGVPAVPTVPSYPSVPAAVSSVLAAVPSVPVAVPSVLAAVPSVLAVAPSVPVAVPSVLAAVPSVPAAVPSVPVALPSLPAVSPSLLVALPSLPAALPPLPVSSLSLPVVLPSLPVSLPVALASLPVSLPSLPVGLPTGLPTGLPRLLTGVPSLPAALPTGISTGLPRSSTGISSFPAALPTGVPAGLPSLPVQIPSVLGGDQPNILPELPTSNLPGAPADPDSLPTLQIDPLTGLPIDDLPLSRVKRALAAPGLDPAVATSILSLLLDIATNLAASVTGDGAATSEPGTVTNLAGGLGSLSGLGKRDGMTAEQQELLTIAHAKNDQLQRALDMLKAVPLLSKRQNLLSVLPLSEASGLTGSVPLGAASALTSNLPLGAASGSTGSLPPLGPASGSTGSLPPLGPASGSTGSLPPLGPASGSTGSLPPLGPASGSTGSLPPLGPASGSTGSLPPLGPASGSTGSLPPLGPASGSTGSLPPLGPASGSTGGLPLGAASDLTDSLPLGTVTDLPSAVSGLTGVFGTVIELLSTILGLLNETPAGAVTSNVPLGTATGALGSVAGVLGQRGLDASALTGLLSTVITILDTLLDLVKLPGLEGLLDNLPVNPATLAEGGLPIDPTSAVGGNPLSALGDLTDKLLVNPTSILSGVIPDPASALGGLSVPLPGLSVPVGPASILSSPLAATSGIKATLSLIQDVPLKGILGGLGKRDGRLHARQLSSSTSTGSLLAPVSGLTGAGGSAGAVLAPVQGPTSIVPSGNLLSTVGSIAGSLPVAQPINDIVAKLPGADAITGLTGALSSDNPVSAITGPLGGNSVVGITGQLAPITNTVLGAASPVLGLVKPVVGLAAPALNAAAPVLSAAQPVTGVLGTVVNAAAPVADAVSPVLNIAQPVVAAISPAIAAISPLAKAAAPLISPIAPLLGAANPFLETVTPVAWPAPSVTPSASRAAPALPSVAASRAAPALSSVPALPSVATSRAGPALSSVAASRATPALPSVAALPSVVALPGLAVLPDLPELSGSLAGLAAPATGILSTITNAASPIQVLLGQLSSLRTSLSSALSALRAVQGAGTTTGLPTLPKRDTSVSTLFIYHTPENHAQALTDEMQIMSQANVQNFIQKWDNVGATMAAANPQAVNDMMEVFMDPSSSPPDMAAMDGSSDELKDFVKEYYQLAQSMDANNASADEKLDVLKAMFNEKTDLKKSKRSMRHGMRESEE